MYLKNIVVRNFRNLEDIELTLSKGTNIFLGLNGQGKTNLIEAIYFSLSLNSFRTSLIDVLVQNQKESAYIQSIVLKGTKQFDIKLKINELGKKEYLVNTKKISGLKARKNFPIILFHPESLAIIKGSADKRRQFIDEILLGYVDKSIDIIKEFQKILRSRNQMLKMMLKNEISSTEGMDVLQSLNINYVKISSQLAYERILILKKILPIVNKNISKISGFDIEISMDYLVSKQDAQNWSFTDLLNATNNRIKELLPAERSSGISLVGAHKHGITIKFNRTDSRYYCSQGQQRALILAFKMAQVELLSELEGLGNGPIVLLDDVLSELDKEKGFYLIEFLKQYPSQTIITNTDLDSNLLESFNDLLVKNIFAGKLS